MVKAELTIEIDGENQLRIGLDLLKREDWKEEEFKVANTIQESLLAIIELTKNSGLVRETYREII